MSALTKFALPLMAALGLGGCDYPKNIREYPEPWKILDPGVPLEKFPKIEIVAQGKGTVIEPGNLVQIHIRYQSASQPNGDDDGVWWLWMGFRSEEETSFFGYEPAAASAVLGLRQGTIFKFIEPKEGIGSGPQYAGKLYLNVFGDTRFYGWRKNTTDFATLYVSDAAGTTALEIKRVCKGPTQYRTVRLFDDSPVEVGPAFRTQVTREPREAWIDEAKIEAVCTDGRKAIFQYGPIPSSNGKAWKDLVQGYFDDYFRDAWKKVPKGVYFEGHPSPVANDVEFRTKQDTPVTFRILPKDQDAEGNKLSVRIVDQPDGVLTANPDGTWTFSPKAKWYGTETLRYRISDGLVVSEDARLRLHVEKK
jgi:hypothetical protein